MIGREIERKSDRERLKKRVIGKERKKRSLSDLVGCQNNYFNQS